MKKLILILFLLPNALFFAQKKEFTLAEAVMQQYRAFAPEKMTMFQWIPNTSEYTYLDKYVVLMRGNTKTNERKVFMTIEELNAALGSKLSWFSNFEWKDPYVFTINDGTHFYSYDTKAKKGRIILELPDGAENQKMHSNTESVAYTVENNLYVKTSTAKTVVVTDNNDPNIVSGQTYARSEFGITNGIFWSPNGNYIAFAEKDESDVHNYPLLNLNETPGKLENIKYPMAGQESERPKIGIFNFKTEYKAFISPKSSPDSYLTNVSWTPDEKFILIAEVNRGQNHMWLNLYDAESGNFVRTLFEEKSDKWIEPEHPAFFPSPSSSNFVWISEQDGFNNLYYYTIEGKLIKKLTSNKFVTKNIENSINKGKEIVFCATGESPLDNKFYAVSLDGKQRALTSISGTHSIAISSDAKFIFDEYSNHSTPSKSIILDGYGKEKLVLLEAEDKLADYGIGNSEIKIIKGNNDFDLYTRLIKPVDFVATKKYPVLVYVYGGPHAQLITNSWLDGASLWMHWMANQGYLVFTVDNRGSAERGFAFESGIHRQLGTLEIEDQMTGVEYLKTLPYVDSNRFAVHGWSFGGFMTTSLMLRQAETFKVGVAGGPVTDWKYYEAMYGERYMDRPEENIEGYKQASLFTHAKNLKGDLLLIHGTVDDVVVMQHNYALIKKFVDLGIQMDFFPYPMHKHNVSGKDRVHLMEKVLNYVIRENQ
jgi:dipeptidyl-peptidase-4